MTYLDCYLLLPKRKADTFSYTRKVMQALGTTLGGGASEVITIVTAVCTWETYFIKFGDSPL